MGNGVKVFTPRELLAKTMPFIWAKLMLRLIAVGIGVGIVALGVWIMSRGNVLPGFVVVIAGLIAYPAICFILNRGAGYFVRLGHIAVLVEMIKTGKAPADGMVEHSKKMVMSRLGAAAAFFFIDKAVDMALNQLMRLVSGAVNLLGSIPGAGFLKTFAKTATKKSLKYADECCIAWIFYGPPEQSAVKGAVDGIVIYFQNWKKILGSAVVTAIIFLVIQFIVGFVIGIGFVTALGGAGSVWQILVLIILALVALAIKQAYLDSWAMIKMLHSYMSVAPTTEIRFDLYTKLKGMSKSFAGLFKKIPQEELNNVPQGAPPPMVNQQPQMMNQQQPQMMNQQPLGDIFCGECGAKNAAGTKFCGDCGKPV